MKQEAGCHGNNRLSPCAKHFHFMSSIKSIRTESHSCYNNDLLKSSFKDDGINVIKVSVRCNREKMYMLSHRNTDVHGNAHIPKNCRLPNKTACSKSAPPPNEPHALCKNFIVKMLKQCRLCLNNVTVTSHLCQMFVGTIGRYVFTIMHRIRKIANIGAYAFVLCNETRMTTQMTFAIRSPGLTVLIVLTCFATVSKRSTTITSTTYSLEAFPG